MATNTLTFSGNEYTIYDLEELSTIDTRLSTTALKIQVYSYNLSEGESPTPEDTAIGSIWLSKRVDV